MSQPASTPGPTPARAGTDFYWLVVARFAHVLFADLETLRAGLAANPHADPARAMILIEMACKRAADRLAAEGPPAPGSPPWSPIGTDRAAFTALTEWLGYTLAGQALPAPPPALAGPRLSPPAVAPAELQPGQFRCDRPECGNPFWPRGGQKARKAEGHSVCCSSRCARLFYCQRVKANGHANGTLNGAAH